MTRRAITLTFTVPVPSADDILAAPSRMLTLMAKTVVRWQVRAIERAHLEGMNAHMLRDMGITRGQARAEASKPFWRR